MPEAQWKCRLLASVDIAGSTAFKAGKPGQDRIHWVSRFQNFFREFPRELEAQSASVAERLPDGHQPPNSRWKTWKFVGDEILMWVDVAQHPDVCVHLEALIKAVEEYQSELRQGEPSLGLKVTAWLANFPVPNAEVSVDQPTEDGNTTSVLDFLGPGIDLGFRLTKFADGRRIPVSAGLALLLASQGGNEVGSQLKLAYMGTEKLKGIMKDRPYPVFWIDRSEEEQTKEDRLLKREMRVHPDDATAYLYDFFKQEAPDRVRPFIPADPLPQWKAIPEFAQEEWDALNSDNLDPEYDESERMAEKVDGRDEPVDDEGLRFPDDLKDEDR